MGRIRGEDELDVDVDVGKVHVYISPHNVALPPLQWSPQFHLPPRCNGVTFSYVPCQGQMDQDQHLCYFIDRERLRVHVKSAHSH